MSKESGFSLFELLIVVVLIGTLAAIAFPNLQNARRAANETSAIGSLKTCLNAQVKYNWSTQTYGSLAQLGTARMVDDSIVNSSLTNPKAGYYYTNGQGASSTAYNIQATRATPGSGTRRFNVTEDNVIRFDTNDLDTPLIHGAGIGVGAQAGS